MSEVSVNREPTAESLSRTPSDLDFGVAMLIMPWLRPPGGVESPLPPTATSWQVGSRPQRLVCLEPTTRMHLQARVDVHAPDPTDEV